MAQGRRALGYTATGWPTSRHGKALPDPSPKSWLTNPTKTPPEPGGGGDATIRWAPGGVMLRPLNSPLKVPKIQALENLYRRTYRLGLARAPGSDGLTAAALAYGSEIRHEYFSNENRRHDGVLSR